MSGQTGPRPLQRVISVIVSERRDGSSATNLASLVRLTGLNKNLVRRCPAAHSSQG
jgi:hypothetical protein